MSIDGIHNPSLIPFLNHKSRYAQFTQDRGPVFGRVRWYLLLLCVLFALVEAIMWNEPQPTCN